MRRKQQWVALMAVLALGLAAGVAQANTTRTWTGSWDPGAPQTGDDIVIESGDLTWNDTLPDTVGNWTQNGGTVTFDTRFDEQGDFQLFTIGGDAVLNGGTWTHTANTGGATAVNRLNVSITGNLTVESAATIHANARGFAANNGPGKGTVLRHGGGYGGLGSAYYYEGTTPWVLPSSAIYGSITAPVDLGSGGSGGGSGGGAIRLVIGGAFSLNGGTISANGGSWPMGSGGSVFITAGSIAGSGTIRANGGGDNINTGGGGGGRVAIVLTGTDADFSSFSSTPTAYGGKTTSPSTVDGAAGTVYLETEPQASGQGRLIVNNTGRGCGPGVFTLMPAGTDLSAFTDVEISGGGNVAVNAGVTLNFATANISGAGAGSAFITIVDDANVSFPDPFTLSGFTLNAEGLSSVTGDWTIAADGRLSHTANPNAEWYKLDLTIDGDLVVTGEINVDGRGYVAGFGPGTTTKFRDGGSHGGIGGSYDGNPPTGTTYGSVVAPVNLGSGSNFESTRFGCGAGAIKLTVTGGLTVSGAISANSGGWSRGSGGSVWISAGTLNGNGAIRANGGPAEASAADFTGGGGGRVAVYLTGPGASVDNFGGTISAVGGNMPNPKDGSAGTVFLQDDAGAQMRVANFAGASVATGVVTLLKDATGLEAAAVSVSVSGTRLTLGADAAFGDLTLASGTTLDLNGYNLYVDVLEKSLDGTVVLNGGQLTWWTPPAGTVISIH